MNYLSDNYVDKHRCWPFAVIRDFDFYTPFSQAVISFVNKEFSVVTV